MKSQILLLALTTAAISSCTTSYKTGQTPDDVYFSPTRPQEEYVQTEKKEKSNYQSRDEYYDDRYLRMRVHNRRWSELDDYYYYGNRYDYSYYNSFYWNNPWSPCTYWNSHYNPYYQSYVVVSPKSPVFNHPRTVNLNTYNSNMLTNNQYSNPNNPKGGTRPFTPSTYTNSSSGNHSGSNGSNSGSFLRNIFNGSSGNSGSSSSSGSSAAPRSSSSSSSGSSSGSSGGGSAPVRRF